MIRILVIVPLLFLLGGCVYPYKQVQTLDNRPGLYIVGASHNALLYVDGSEIGLATNYNGNPNVLLLEPGTHRIEIHQGSDVVYSSDVFLGEGTRREIKLSNTKR